MIFDVNKSIILESLSLLEEEMSQMARNGMKVGAVGAGLGLAHAGTFGSGVKNAVDGSYDAVRGAASAAGSKIGNEATAAGHFYGGDKMFQAKESAPVSDVRQKVEHDAQHASVDAAAPIDDAADDDSGIGILGGLGLAAAGGIAAHVAGNGVGKTASQVKQGAHAAYGAAKSGVAATGHGVKNFGSALKSGGSAFKQNLSHPSNNVSRPTGYGNLGRSR